MRLTSEEIDAIKTLSQLHFGNVSVYLFGSRTDDNKNGGDIDLLILSDTRLTMGDKLKFKVDLIRKIGDQKLDIISYTRNETNTFLDVIINEAIKIK
jgi:predicted nucleotidyltransferase